MGGPVNSELLGGRIQLVVVYIGLGGLSILALSQLVVILATVDIIQVYWSSNQRSSTHSMCTYVRNPKNRNAHFDYIAPQHRDGAVADQPNQMCMYDVYVGESWQAAPS